MCKQVVAKTTEISHDEWLKLRLKGIGGSDCAAAEKELADEGIPVNIICKFSIIFLSRDYRKRMLRC